MYLARNPHRIFATQNWVEAIAENRLAAPGLVGTLGGRGRLPNGDFRFANDLVHAFLWLGTPVRWIKMLLKHCDDLEKWILHASRHRRADAIRVLLEELHPSTRFEHMRLVERYVSASV